MMDSRHTIRDELVQALLLKSEKDLTDLRNLSDIRVRFIPRQALMDTISHEQVVRLLKQEAREASHSLPDVATYISPQLCGCHCQRIECTGARMIFAILLLIGRESLITTLLSPTEPIICDQDLMHGKTFDSRIWDSRSDLEENDHGPGPGGSTQRRLSSANVEHDPIPLRLLSPSERQLFLYWRLQVISPYLSLLSSDKTGDVLPDELSLPWQEVEGIPGHMEQAVSYVQKVKIFPGNHNLVSFCLAQV